MEMEDNHLGHLFLQKIGSSKAQLDDISVSRPGSATTTTFAWLPDTGADVDAISQTDAERIDSHLSRKLSDERLRVCAANGERLESLGTCLVTLKLGEKSCQSVLHVFKKLSVPLLSRQSCMNLGLLPHGWPSRSVQAITQAGSIIVPPAEACNDLPISQVKEAILSEWSDVFQEEHLKPMAGPPMHINLDSNAVPHKCFRARTIPFHWRDSVRSQLDSMMKKGVIERVPVGETYDLCHPMVVVPKKDSQEPRITVDLTALNKFAKRPAYPVRPPRDAVAAIPKGINDSVSIHVDSIVCPKCTRSFKAAADWENIFSLEMGNKNITIPPPHTPALIAPALLAAKEVSHCTKDTV